MKPTTRTLLPAFAVAAGLLSFVACGSVSAERPAGPRGGAGDRGGSAPLLQMTIGDLDARLNLSDRQRAGMERALDRLHEQRRNLIRRGGWGIGRGGRGFGRGTRGTAEPPAIAFIESASKILTPDQFADFARFMAERRDEFSRNGGPTRFRERLLSGDHRFGDRVAQKLDLSDRQRKEIRSILAEKADDADHLREQVRSGALSREEGFSEARDLRTSTREQVRDVLTPDQRGKADVMRRERIDQRIDQRLSQLRGQLERRAEFLDRVLGLDKSQARRVHVLLTDSVHERTEVLNEVRSGAIEPEQAAGRILDIERNIASRIETMLTPEQMDRWNALQELLPRSIR
jgi:Spy/CpxP family protein refolding chaperone